MFRAALVFLLIPSALMADHAAVPREMPLHDAVKIVTERFQGRLLAARIDPPDPYEFALGADAIHELVLLSPQGNILKFRLDAKTGRILDVRGRGLTEARIHQDRKGD